ncbi:MAG: hypothetical protein LC798_10880 [Chloroflexi bacterium]|nr:hypothetical protein [Chloroflexota bacterium]
MQLEEVLWTLAALPGLIMWVRNRIVTGRTLKAAQQLQLHLTNGRLVWAKFARRKTTVLAGIELVFVLVGVLAMTRAPNPYATTGARLVTLVSLICASAALTWLAYDWQNVHRALIGDFARRDDVRDDARDTERDPVRDLARDIEHDKSPDE